MPRKTQVTDAEVLERAAKIATQYNNYLTAVKESPEGAAFIVRSYSEAIRRTMAGDLGRVTTGESSLGDLAERAKKVIGAISGVPTPETANVG